MDRPRTPQITVHVEAQGINARLLGSAIREGIAAQAKRLEQIYVITRHGRMRSVDRAVMQPHWIAPVVGILPE